MSTLKLDTYSLKDSDFRKISRLVYEHCGINLHEGKRELVRARLAKRLRLGKFKSFPEYMRHMLQDETGKEFSMLIDSLSTNLTSFFRENQHFEYLKTKLLPPLLAKKRKQNTNRIRCWSAGCSSGEEPYSIAITMLEALTSQGRWDLKILATDISTEILEKAKKGIYDQARVAVVPGMLKNRYLIRQGSGDNKTFEVGLQLRQAVIFHYLNLMESWPITGPLDFIFCRNVMIYFDKPTQQKLVNRFYDILDSGGILFTGHSESLTGIKNKFDYVQPTIYLKP